MPRRPDSKVPVLIYLPPKWKALIDETAKKKGTNRSQFMSAVSHETAKFLSEQEEKELKVYDVRDILSKPMPETVNVYLSPEQKKMMEEAKNKVGYEPDLDGWMALVCEETARRILAGTKRYGGPKDAREEDRD